MQVLEPDLDLRTVKYFIWKSSGDVRLFYREKPSLSTKEEDEQDKNSLKENEQPTDHVKSDD